MASSKNIYLIYSLFAVLYSFLAISLSNPAFLYGGVALMAIGGCFVVEITKGDVFFFDKKHMSRYNLLYPFSVISGGLIISGSESLNYISLSLLATASIAAATTIFLVSYLLFRKYWIGMDTTLSVAVMSVLLGGGIVLNVSSAFKTSS